MDSRGRSYKKRDKKLSCSDSARLQRCEQGKIDIFEGSWLNNHKICQAMATLIIPSIFYKILRWPESFALGMDNKQQVAYLACSSHSGMSLELWNL